MCDAACPSDAIGLVLIVSAGLYQSNRSLRFDLNWGAIRLLALGKGTTARCLMGAYRSISQCKLHFARNTLGCAN